MCHSASKLHDITSLTNRMEELLYIVALLSGYIKPLVHGWSGATCQQTPPQCDVSHHTMNGPLVDLIQCSYQ